MSQGSSCVGLPLADQGGKVLREVDGLGDLGRLRVELGELLGLGLGALRRAPQHQPGRPARRQAAGHGGLRHHGQASGARPWRRGGMPWAWRMRLT